MASRQVILTTRWLLVPVAAVFGFIAAVLPSFVASYIICTAITPDGHPRPGKDFASCYSLAVSGALAAFFFVLFGTRAAPKHHLTVSLILLVTGGIVAWMLLEVILYILYMSHPRGIPEQIMWEPFVGTYSGGVAACIMVYFRASLRRVFRFRRFK